MQRALNVARRKWISLLSSVLFCVPIAFIIAIAWFNLQDKMYSVRNLALAAFSIFALAIWGVWFVIDNFLSWLKSKQINASRRDYVLLIVALIPVIAAIYFGWISYGG